MEMVARLGGRAFGFGKSYKWSSALFWLEVFVVKFSELVGKEVYVELFKVGEVKGAVVDAEEWKVTHLEIELTKEAAKDLLGVDSPVRNVLAISAVGPASQCCDTSRNRIDLKVSKNQLNIYLRPT
jgi:sporulation protein YlmC with PRC-barrel domain